MKRAGILVLLLAGCSHGEPFPLPDNGTDVPYRGGAPAQLTANPRADRSATWLPDGSGILYSAERDDLPTLDWCLEELPPTGGRARRSICDHSSAEYDSTNTFDLPAVSVGGRLAWWRRASFPFRSVQSNQLMIAQYPDGAATVRLTLPRTLGVLVGTLFELRWLGLHTIVMRTEGGTYLVEADSSELAGITALPIGATSIATDSAGEVVYYTRPGDSRVWRYNVGARDSTVLWNFGSGIPDGIQVAGSRLVASVGGDLVRVDLATGQATTLNLPTFFYSRPALSPDGTRLVAERNQDLWLFDL